MSKPGLTYREFSAKREEVDDLGAAIGLVELAAQPGFVYPGGCWINKTDHGFSLVITNHEWQDDNLVFLERLLHQEWHLRECV
jgi:hypothetical protein